MISCYPLSIQDTASTFHAYCEFTCTYKKYILPFTCSVEFWSEELIFLVWPCDLLLTY